MKSKTAKRLIALALGIAASLLIATTTAGTQMIPEAKQAEEPPRITIEEITPPEPIEIKALKIAGRPELTKQAYDIVRENRELGIETLPATWILALEWCESRGDNSAINEEDLDGTPSYYAFQFKPATFRYYAEQYGIIEKGLPEAELMNELADFENTRATVWEMMKDPGVNWEQQFPWCVTKYIGRPPEIPRDGTNLTLEE